MGIGGIRRGFGLNGGQVGSVGVEIQRLLRTLRIITFLRSLELRKFHREDVFSGLVFAKRICSGRGSECSTLHVCWTYFQPNTAKMAWGHHIFEGLAWTWAFGQLLGKSYFFEGLGLGFGACALSGTSERRKIVEVLENRTLHVFPFWISTFFIIIYFRSLVSVRVMLRAFALRWGVGNSRPDR